MASLIEFRKKLKLRVPKRLVHAHIPAHMLAGIWALGCLYVPNGVAQTTDGNQDTLYTTSKADSTVSPRYLHHIEADIRPAYIFHTHPFLKGHNDNNRVFRNALSAHLKYAFRFAPHTLTARAYGHPYQGIGLGYYTFDEPDYLGSPLAAYLFQGAPVCRIAPWLTLNYEWNFGLSFGWQPYNASWNSDNRVIGSRLNAYMNVNVFFNWWLSKRIDLTTGVSLTHFSNGNTKVPNAGLNTIALKLGVIYKLNGTAVNSNQEQAFLPEIPVFKPHISYDATLFGSWRRRSFIEGDKGLASPDTYSVFGFNFAPMYNFCYRFRGGLSLDGVYDQSADLKHEGSSFVESSFNRQIALGLSVRAEYVMPFFTIGMGYGRNVLCGSADMRNWYQMLSLKIATTRSSYLHVGYNLRDFKEPNFLMLGIGYRFNNRTPSLRFR